MDKLRLAAVCALADLLGLYEEGGLGDAQKQTIVDLYFALAEDNWEIINDYGDQAERVLVDLGISGLRR